MNHDERPTAAPNEWPYADHRTMADVLADEQRGCFCEMVDRDGDTPSCAFRLANPEAWEAA